MRMILIVCCFVVLLAACDDTRVYEQITDFEERVWIVSSKPVFEFVIDDSTQRYNLYADIRNTVSYPYSRFFFTFYLQDSIGTEIHKNLKTEFLFDSKTGKPFGKSGIGDLYDHRFLLLKDYEFKNGGKHQVVFEQFMRMDTLSGITAVGLRVEKSAPGK